MMNPPRFTSAPGGWVSRIRCALELPELLWGAVSGGVPPGKAGACGGGGKVAASAPYPGKKTNKTRRKQPAIVFTRIPLQKWPDHLKRQPLVQPNSFTFRVLSPGGVLLPSTGGFMRLRLLSFATMIGMLSFSACSSTVQPPTPYGMEHVTEVSSQNRPSWVDNPGEFQRKHKDRKYFV